MALQIISLNSGSNGNCYYIGNTNEAVLIDAGISCRETERRLERTGLSLKKIKAVFISHEHSDHIQGVEVLSRKHQIPVYITPPTLLKGRLNIDASLLHSFKPHEPVKINDLSVIAFPKKHDAADPHSFIVEGLGIKIGIFTDIGVPCNHVIRYFSQCHAAFLETNYDEEMLETGNYPRQLKKRISGNKGHLSNKQALELFINHKPEFMSHLLLAHLSQENNSPERVQKLFLPHSKTTIVYVASRYKESEIFNIEIKTIHRRMKNPGTVNAQLSLF